MYSRQCKAVCTRARMGLIGREATNLFNNELAIYIQFDNVTVTNYSHYRVN